GAARERAPDRCVRARSRATEPEGHPARADLPTVSRRAAAREAAPEDRRRTARRTGLAGGGDRQLLRATDHGLRRAAARKGVEEGRARRRAAPIRPRAASAPSPVVATRRLKLVDTHTGATRFRRGRFSGRVAGRGPRSAS